MMVSESSSNFLLRLRHHGHWKIVLVFNCTAREHRNTSTVHSSGTSSVSDRHLQPFKVRHANKHHDRIQELTLEARQGGQAHTAMYTAYKMTSTRLLESSPHSTRPALACGATRGAQAYNWLGLRVRVMGAAVRT